MKKEIASYTEEALIFFLKASTKEEVLHTLCLPIAQKIEKEQPQLLPQLSSQVLEKAILQREKLISTGIGMGIAIPHAKISNFPRFILTIGILDQGIDWSAIDSSLVRFVFMIIGPDNAPEEYLKLLSAITNLMRSEEARRQCMATKNPRDILNLLHHTL